MNWIKVVPTWVYELVIVLVAMVACFFAGERHQAAQDQLAQKAAKADQQTEVIRDTNKVLAKEHQDAQTTEKVDNHVQTQLQQLQDVNGMLAARVDGLRSQLATVRADALSKGESSSRLAAQVAALSDSLGECSREYSTVAKQHDECAVALKGWQELYPASPDPAASTASVD